MAKNGRLLWTQKIVEGTTSKRLANGGIVWTSESVKAKTSKWMIRKNAEKDSALTGGQMSGIVLGIDPSLRGTGLAVLESMPDGTLRYIESLTVSNHKSLSMPECLANIFKQTAAIIERTHPVCAAIEQSVYVQNFKTAMILGSSRGAAIAAASLAGLDVYEYPPLRIKQAVIGYGRASKEQVSRSVCDIVKGAGILPNDESDAAGAAIAHIYTHKIKSV